MRLNRIGERGRMEITVVEFLVGGVWIYLGRDVARAAQSGLAGLRPKIGAL